MREELLRWMRSGRVTEMVYVDRHGTFSERRVKLIKVQGEYVVAWDLNKQARRTFRIEQILACLPINERFRKRKAEIG
ncbi:MULTISPECIES: WYL domain-containing protein [unclassified Exiguobacterium]|uniref:WYL domain-containing protein n=1 Tax=unclassified Exiguobacterium TaxID=2644629 RepID=UPI001BE9B625|nr:MULTISPECIES: WYL domain-containing protein [unclassified Exiguobacterium]